MKHRLQFTAKKLVRMAILLLGVSLTAFLLMDASPLDPLQTNIGQTALGSMSPAQIARLEEYWGVNTPAAERYLNWLRDALRGDFGTSLLYRQPVLAVIGQRLGSSLWVLLSAWLLSGLLGLARLRHALLPGLTLALTGAASVALHTREKVADVLDSDYILFARARGEGSILLRHVLRNVVLPAITLQFASIGEIIGGSVLVEQVFSYPGLGQAAVAAGLGGDLPLLLGVTVVTAALVFGGSLTADLLYGAVDPRIRRGASRG